MDMLKLTGYEGPRTVEPQELEAVRELSRSVFFPKLTNYLDAARTWPMALRPAIHRDMFAMFHDGRPVSVIGRLERDIVVHGVALRMGFIGDVCTHPDHRNKGLAGTILAACFKRFHENGVDIVYISGGRGLYLRAGANPAGGLAQFVLKPSVLAVRPPAPSLRVATVNDASLLAKLCALEPVRFIRPRSDYELIIQYGHCCGRPCEFIVLEGNGTPVGYLHTSRPAEKDGRVSQHVFEYGGDRAAVFSAIAQLAGQLPANGDLRVDVHGADGLGRLLGEAGLSGQPVRFGGTLKLLDSARTMRKLKPYLAEHLPVEAVDSLEFATGGERYVVWCKGGSLRIDGESNMLWTLLGPPPGQQVANVHAAGALRDLVTRCLPLPLPSIYVNVI